MSVGIIDFVGRVAKFTNEATFGLVQPVTDLKSIGKKEVITFAFIDLPVWLADEIIPLVPRLKAIPGGEIASDAIIGSIWLFGAIPREIGKYLIADRHSQGTIILRIAVENVCRDKTKFKDYLGNLHVHTFASPAGSWIFPNVESVATLEHYANIRDGVARMGVLDRDKSAYGGNVYIREDARGHTFNISYSLEAQHYSWPGKSEPVLDSCQRLQIATTKNAPVLASLCTSECPCFSAKAE
ncbi:hypothetical protein BKA69DRAFT_121087 [Paraphysoderma sedebokerense]|nr:hypothetical protein BKA69DRAFT_121087 [Paraphysoderma sedebokerense]